jgi:hypothetical protein
MLLVDDEGVSERGCFVEARSMLSPRGVPRSDEEPAEPVDSERFFFLFENAES